MGSINQKSPAGLRHDDTKTTLNNYDHVISKSVKTTNDRFVKFMDDKFQS